MGPDAMILVFWMLSFKPVTYVQLTFRPNITGELDICNYIQLNDKKYSVFAKVSVTHEYMESFGG